METRSPPPLGRPDDEGIVAAVDLVVLVALLDDTINDVERAALAGAIEVVRGATPRRCLRTQMADTLCSGTLSGRMGNRLRMHTTRSLIQDYAEMGRRSAFDLKSGRHCEGYVLSVEEHHLVFGSGGPLAPDEPEWIPLEDVDLSSLSHWDEEKRCWMTARWDEVLKRWVTALTQPQPAPRSRPERRPWWRFW